MFLWSFGRRVYELFSLRPNAVFEVWNDCFMAGLKIDKCLGLGVRSHQAGKDVAYMAIC